MIFLVILDSSSPKSLRHLPKVTENKWFWGLGKRKGVPKNSRIPPAKLLHLRVVCPQEKK